MGALVTCSRGLQQLLPETPEGVARWQVHWRWAREDSFWSLPSHNIISLEVKMLALSHGIRI